MHIAPPDELEKRSYVKSYKTRLSILGLASCLLLLTGMIRFTLGHPSLWWFLAVILLFMVYLGTSYLVMFMGGGFDFEEHYRRFCKVPISPPQTIDVFLPVCNEPVDVILNTWKYVKKIRYDRLKVHVLDDSKVDPNKESPLKVAAKEMGFNYIQRGNNKNKKAGNLKNAFEQTDGHFILILDADFAPRADIINHTLAEMVHDSRVAIVQTPQYFEVSGWMNWIEKGAGFVQELFYRLVQVNRNKFGGSICVGSCALYRRSALTKVGGFYQIEHSEDVHTGWNLVRNGYKIQYLPLNLAKGRCPDTLASFFTQQYRWCSGSMNLFFNKEFWRSSLSPMQKICYLSGMLYYMASSFGVLILQLPAVFMVWMHPEHVRWFNLFYYAPSFLFGTLVIGVWSSYKFGFHYLKVRHISYWAHMFSLKDKLMGSLAEWVPTGSVTKNSKFNQAKKLMIGWAIITFLLTNAGIIYNKSELNVIDILPCILFSQFNYWLVISIFTGN